MPCDVFKCTICLIWLEWKKEKKTSRWYQKWKLTSLTSAECSAAEVRHTHSTSIFGVSILLWSLWLPSPVSPLFYSRPKPLIIISTARMETRSCWNKKKNHIVVSTKMLVLLVRTAGTRGTLGSQQKQGDWPSLRKRCPKDAKWFTIIPLIKQWKLVEQAYI